MHGTVHLIAASSIGALVASALWVGSPVLAGQLDMTARAKGKKVTSAQIKDGTIRRADLGAEVTVPLDKAATALQGVPDNAVTSAKVADGAVTSAKVADGAVTSAKVADGAVTSAKVADNSVTGTDLAPNSVGSSELGDNTVAGANVVNGSLSSLDVASERGTDSRDPLLIPAGTCGGEIVTDPTLPLTNDIIVVTPSEELDPRLVISSVQPRPTNNTDFVINLCNISAVNLNPPPMQFAWAVIEN